MARSAVRTAALRRGAATTRAERTGRRPAFEQRLLPLLLVADAVSVVSAYAIAFFVRVVVPLPLTDHLLPMGWLEGPHTALLVALASQFPLLYFFGLYDVRLLRSELSLFGAPFSALVVQMLVIAGWYFFRGEEFGFPRSVLLILGIFNLAFVISSRLGVRKMLRARRGVLRVLLMGRPDEVAELARMLDDSSTSGHSVEVVGAVRVEGFGPPGEPVGDCGLEWLGGARELAEIAEAEAVDQIILVPSEDHREGWLDRALRGTDLQSSPRIAVVPSVHELLIGRLASLSIDDVPLIEVSRDPRQDLGFAIKAVMDYVLATILLVIAAPICALAALAIRLSSPGPIFYRQRRVGQGGHEFMMYKLRTMRVDAEGATGPVLARHGDERVTSVGRFLRETRIDEIPQLLNVLNGTMSLVGPRPERPEFVRRLAREIPGYTERWLVKPGVSGLAQVRGEYDTSAGYKLKYDLAYIHNYSLLLDVRIMAETVKALLTRRGI